MRVFPLEEYRFGELVAGVPGGIGPRILSLAHAGSPEKNMFSILPEAGASTPDGFWRIFGGHRLWTAPEASPRSYSPDDSPVKLEQGEGFLRLTGPVEEKNSVRKTIEIREKGAGADVAHRIENTGRWPVRTACWALSVMAPGGTAFAPLMPEPAGGLLPDRRLALWPYSSLSDRRISFEEEFAFVRHVPGAPGPVKLGFSARPEAAGYFLGGDVFVKRIVSGGGERPDFGSSVEIYSCGDFLELETLGEEKLVEPGCSIEHVETWRVARGAGEPTAENARKALSIACNGL